IVYPNPTAATNLEPLLINTAGSCEDRPEAVTEVDNLFLAADYVRTHSDPAIFAPARALDRVLFGLGRPPREQVRVVDGRLKATGLASAGASVAGWLDRIRG